MSKILTLTELTTALTDIQTPITNYPASIFEYYFCLYNTGCRPEELFEISRWSHVGTLYQLQPLKGNSQRLFGGASLSINFKTNIVNQTTPFQYMNYRRMEYNFRIMFAYSNASVGDKGTGLYTFRYRYVKQLVADGLSYSTIQAMMGWSSTSLVGEYAGADIIVD